MKLFIRMPAGIRLQNIVLISQPIAHQSFHPVVIRTKASQLHFLAVLDFFGITVSPFDWDLRICIRINENIEGAVPV